MRNFRDIPIKQKLMIIIMVTTTAALLLAGVGHRRRGLLPFPRISAARLVRAGPDHRRQQHRRAGL